MEVEQMKTVKPRLFRVWGVWHCIGKGRGLPILRLGVGCTPIAAYRDWRRGPLQAAEKLTTRIRLGG